MFCAMPKLITWTIHEALFTLFIFLIMRVSLRKLRHQRGDIRKLPDAPMKYSWIWGHELEIFHHEACEMHTKWAASMGPMYCIKAALFQSDIVIVNDTVAMQHIFQEAYNYVKAPAFRPIIERLIGNGIVYAESEEHRHQRRLLAPAFTSNAVKAMFDDIHTCADRLSRHLRAKLNNNASRTDGIIDIAPLLSACTLDIIGRVAFGHDFGGGESKEAKDIASAWHQDVLLAHRFGGFLAPKLINLFPWITRLPIPLLPVESVSKRIVNRLAGRLLQNDDLISNADGTDILSLLVKDNLKKGKPEGCLSDTELLDNITTFMMVGHETSGASLIFTLFELARNPTIQQRLRQEVETAGHLDCDRVQLLPYLDSVIKEGLRLYPALPLTERVALQDDVIPLGTPLETKNGDVLTSILIKAGQVFHIPLTTFNVNPRIWGENASQFVPERWIEPSGVPLADKLPHGPWAGISTFSDGPRSCIGYKLAVLELKIIIAILVRSFKFEVTGVKIEQYMLPTLQSFADGKAASMPLKISLVPEQR